MSDEADPDGDSAFLPQPGALVAGKYRVESVVGRGGMGRVYAVTHVGLGQRMALKVVSPRLALSRDAVARFENEARAAASLHSRHVIQVFDTGRTETGLPYIAMELLEGEPLDRRLARVGRLGVVDTARVLDHVGRALSRAHRAGIVHRDLKPANVFVTCTEEGEELCKVVDFGIAKMAAAEGQSSTRTGALMGTPLYMSPEQARGLKTVDHRSDLYALTLLAYSLLTGRSAFAGESFGDLVLAICTHPLPSLGAHVPGGVSPALEAWFQRGAAREPEQRFQSAEEQVAAFVSAAGLTAGASAQLPPGEQRAPFISTPYDAAPVAASAPPSGSSWAPVLFALAGFAVMGTVGAVLVARAWLGAPSHEVSSPVTASSAAPPPISAAPAATAVAAPSATQAPGAASAPATRSAGKPTAPRIAPTGVHGGPVIPSAPTRGNPADPLSGL